MGRGSAQVGRGRSSSTRMPARSQRRPSKAVMRDRRAAVPWAVALPMRRWCAARCVTSGNWMRAAGVKTSKMKARKGTETLPQAERSTSVRGCHVALAAAKRPLGHRTGNVEVRRGVYVEHETRAAQV
jgi:hypothetical protein